MKCRNSYYFTVCKNSIKLLPLITSSFLFGCNEQKVAQQVLPIQNQVTVSKNAININTASAGELEKIPHIGVKLAEKIIEHRERFGKFRKAEFLMLVDGIRDKRFREIRSSVKVE